ncbi:peptide/nickel transport system substrate-binding protein [Granulicella rosea]|uniref:Peptide/nickel transport system substrate-binding protein n=1 Tax=Granulicella rosea TaxID=474952 RepID=A0A239J5C6_9BACT|nr:ABC transporter substrate-binding protein [Granulicella rosea]SNS99854.1 peptide/nickel transport system substrate-binding protein [Granulicella rosea]
MRRLLAATGLLGCLPLASCRSAPENGRTVVMIVESSPNNLDLRLGTDAQSERIGSLVFDPLVRKDEHFEMQPWLATRWEQPDPLTWIFHLRSDVYFHNGQPLAAADVVWTIESLIDGSLITSKGGAFSAVASVEARDPLTVVIHMKRPDASLLFNLSDGLFGVVPRGSGRDLGQHPIGSGPFRFESAEQDKEVVLDRNDRYWAGTPKLERVLFSVVPDAVTAALELKKGSADIASNVLTLDMVHTLEHAPGLAVEAGPGSTVYYLNFNVTQGPLRDRRVRQAIACAMDRTAIVRAVWRDQARLATTLLPPGHWAEARPETLARYPQDLARAARLLDEAGFPVGKDGVRLGLEIKISTDETTRLLAIVLQQQLRAAGIRLTLRSAEFGTFYSDVTRGVFQIYSLKWIGSNEDPDIFRYAYGSDRFPPKGGNRGRYSNPKLDADLTAAANSSEESTRKGYFVDAQKILAEDVPGIPLWFPNNEIVHTQRVTKIVASGSGSYDFLRTAELK